jgi:hypothetical protein
MFCRIGSAIVFRQMGHEPDTRMTGQTAIELCRRVGGKVTVQGSITSLGTTYARRTGRNPLRHGQTNRLRTGQKRLNRTLLVDALESKATAAKCEPSWANRFPQSKIQRTLEQATTSRLRLCAYGMALSTWDARGDLASLPFFKSDRNRPELRNGLWRGLRPSTTISGDDRIGHTEHHQRIQAQGTGHRVRAGIDRRPLFASMSPEVDKTASPMRIWPRTIQPQPAPSIISARRR